MCYSEPESADKLHAKEVAYKNGKVMMDSF
jgi:hypothetical protein